MKMRDRYLLGILVAVAALAVFVSVIVETGVSRKTGPVWRVAEWTFQADRDYTSGGGDAVRLDMTFVHETSGRKIVRPGFWDGERSFKVRFAPTETGRWRWRSACPDDKALDGRTGRFDAEPYRGDLAVYRHGFIRAEPGRKYFTYADGTPFFYLGDTHWGMYREEFDSPGPAAGDTGAESHFKHVVRRRVEQGFTVYQSEPIGAKFDLRDGRVDAADIAGFREADGYYQTIADAGLVHANAEFFYTADLTPSLASDEAALERLCRYWTARFGAYPVLWTLAQEVDNDFYAERKQKSSFYSVTNNPWVKIAEFLHRHDGYAHPLSGHQENTDNTTVTNSAFADAAVARRTGHNWWAAQWGPTIVARVGWRIATEYWQSDRPAVNYEGRYCNLWTKDFGSRAQGWIAFLSGFCGYGYGAIDHWLYQSTYDIEKESYDGYETITKDDKLVPWSKSLEFPSAIQMGYLREFFEALPWWELEPDRAAWKFYAPDKDAVGTVAAKAGEIYVGYFNGTNVYTGKLLGARAEQPYACDWFNPRAGTRVALGDIRATKRGELILPRKPSEKDWVFTARLKDCQMKDSLP